MVKKEYNTEFTIEGLGRMRVRFTLAMGRGSLAMFSLGSDIAKYSGLSSESARKYSDTSSSSYIHGMCNVMNGGKDIYYYTNASRLKGRVGEIGLASALLERSTYELGHLTFLIYAMNLGSKNSWVEDKWPCVGEGCDISEEQYVQMLGKLGELIGVDYMRMYDKLNNS